MTAALLELFLTFAAQEAEHGRADGRRLVVDPTRLREALAAFKAAAFRIGVSQGVSASISLLLAGSLSISRVHDDMLSTCICWSRRTALCSSTRHTHPQCIDWVQLLTHDHFLCPCKT